MKKIPAILIVLLCLSIMALPVLAAKEGVGAPGDGSAGTAGDNSLSHEERSVSVGSEDNSTAATQPQKIAGTAQRDARDTNKTKPSDSPRNISQIPELKNQSDKDLAAIPRNASAVPKGWEKNPNTVRDAVHALLAMENRTGGIGPQVSALAREFNNSANASDKYEARIRNRDAVTLFFFGGDRQAATELSNLTLQNQVHISEIENLMNTTTLDTETRAEMDQQIQILRQQMEERQQLITQVQKNRGIFGWIG